MSDSPSTTVTENAKNPSGQRHTMSGTTGVPSYPSQDLTATKNVKIDPVSSLGCNLVEKHK